ncbi:TolC family protein [bacterium]|nr:TolC family protein [bacterium]MBU1636463.1 TolC family protein [bacterium]MBU1921529.1 TolC family protein [bacterium]
MKSAICRFTFFGALILIVSFAIAAEPDSSSWPLDRCIDQALQSSAMFKAGRWSRQAAEAEYAENQSRLLPSLSANGSYAYTSETMHLNIATPPIPGYTAPEIKFGDGNVYDLNLNARIPIYAGGAQRQQAMAKHFAARAAGFDLQADSLRLLRDVRRAYFEVVAAETRLEAADNRVARLSRHLEEIESAKKIGTVSEEMRLTALAGLRAAEGEELRLSAAATAARLQLGNLVGLPDNEIKTAGELDSSLITEGDEDIMQRPELSAFDHRIMQAQRAAMAAKGSFLPSLNGAAAYHYGRPGINQVQNEWMDYYTIGLNASWTLWDFGARSHRVNTFRMTGNALNSSRESVEQFYRTMLAAARSAVSSAKPAVIKMQEHLNLQREILGLVEGRLQAGMATENEYLDAQDDLFTAETMWITATAALRTAEADLLYAQGR